LVIRLLEEVRMSKMFLSTALLLAVLLVPALAQDSTEPAKPETQPAATTETKPETESSLTAEATLCTGVVDRMAQGEATTFSSDIGEIYLWCRIKGAEDTTYVEHKWYYRGEEKAAVKLSVKGSSWRTWSSKKILPEWTGGWEVRIVDADQKVVKTLSFTVQ
jgi:hypothetical protein